MASILSIYFSINILISCLGYCKYAAMNMGVQIPFQLSVFISLDKYAEVELQGPLVVLFNSLKKSSYYIP